MRKTVNTFDSLLEKLRGMLPLLRTQYHVRSNEVFGSFVRGDDREGSDLELLVTFEEVPTLFEVFRARRLLERRTGH